MYSEKCLCGQLTLALVFSATEAKWLLKMFTISTGFVTVLLLWFKVLGILVDISFNVINYFIPFQVLLILFQLDSKNFKKQLCSLLIRGVYNIFVYILYSL